MKNQKYFVVYSPDEIAIVIQSLNRLRNALIRENRDSGCVDELLLKVVRSCKKTLKIHILSRPKIAAYSAIE